MLYEVSGETYLYDDRRDWQINKMSTRLNEVGAPSTQVVMRQKMNAPRHLVNAAFLPFEVEAFCDEAWQDHGDHLCVCRQIAALTKQHLHKVCNTFDDILGGDGWRQEGLSAEEIQKYAALNGHPFFYVLNGSMVHQYEPEDKRQRALACVCYDGHAFFLKTARTVMDWRVRPEVSNETRVLLKNDIKRVLPPFKDWKNGRVWWLLGISTRTTALPPCALGCWSKAKTVKSR